MKLFHTDEVGNTELKNYIGPVTAGFDIENIAPKFSDVETKFVRDILGKDEFDSLCENFADDVLEPAQEQLLPYCQKIIANLGYLMYLPLGNAYFSNYGITVGQTEKTAPASQWRLRDIKNTFAYDGFNAIEELLKFLWESPEGTYPDWEESPNRNKHRELLILTAEDFSKYFWIDDSYQLYRMFKPTLRNVQKYYLRGLLGKELYAEIVEQNTAGTLTELNQVLLDDFILPAMAQITFYEAAPRLRLDISEFGISQRQISDRESEDVKLPATDNAYGDGVTSSERTGQVILSDLREYLYENHADYPLYESSAAYAQREAEETARTENGNPINKSDDRIISLF